MVRLLQFEPASLHLPVCSTLTFVALLCAQYPDDTR